ncbi:MAG: SMC-Scp complex subunit ScpB [Clostridia bacterium]|nr:SMC-Scp complex subunit ScpB [Clostridia bacterium]
MKINQTKAAIEAILFTAGREVKISELMSALELSSDEIIEAVNSMQQDAKKEDRGIQVINVGDAYQLGTKKEYYEVICSIFDKRNKPNLSQAALETLAIIAYNPRITRAEIEAIRGVNSDGTIYKLLDYNLIEETGKLDAPGRPGTYGVTSEFLRMFGFTNLNELPDLPRYKLDENQQIVIDEIIEENVKQEEISEREAPMPDRETSKEEKMNMDQKERNENQ